MDNNCNQGQVSDSKGLDKIFTAAILAKIFTAAILTLNGIDWTAIHIVCM